MLTWFAIWQAEVTISIGAAERDFLERAVRTVTGAQRGHLMVPTEITDPHFQDRSGTPSLVLQLDFTTIAALEQALAADGPLAAIADQAFLPELQLSHQAMQVRRYPVGRGPAQRSVAYWVEYAGSSGDSREWLYRYAQTHPDVLTRMPGIRLVELYTPTEVICGLPIPVRPCIQRNKTVWDSEAAMNRAMASGVRAELREDMARLPPFDGQQLHFPFSSERLDVGRKMAGQAGRARPVQTKRSSR